MTDERFEISLPGSPRHLRVVRSFLEMLAAHSPEVLLGPQAIIGIQLAVQEACINAIRYGESGRLDARVRVVFIVGPESLTVEVRDHGPGFDPDGIPPPDPELLREGGYGVHIMKQGVHRVEARRESGEFVLSLTRYYDDARMAHAIRGT
ncbi:MAG: ATP-binding protein [Planctomycetes bacterium]|nr:ATP-binding protein [Planctomycetota bacterium]